MERTDTQRDSGGIARQPVLLCWQVWQIGSLINDVENTRNLRIAYLEAAELEGLGHCGGLLLVNGLGRPVEFHCSTPVRPNRTQEILYGQTLRRFLWCEQIGTRLLAECRSRPALLMIRQPELLPLRQQANGPVALAMGGGDDTDLPEPAAEPPAMASQYGALRTFVWCQPADTDAARRVLDQLHAALPLEEPFQRIRQAIEEAQAAIR